MTPTLAQTSLFGLPTSRQPKAKIENTAATITAKKLHDVHEIAVAETTLGTTRFTRTTENPWMAPKKNGRIAFSVVIVLHLALIWSIQSGFMGRVKQHAVAKTVLMTYFAPLKSLPTPAQKSPPKTVAVTTPVLIAPTLAPVAPAVENIIETVNKHLPVTPVQSAEVVMPTAVVNAIVPKTIISGIEYIQAPQPVYPALAKRAGEQGKVMLRVLVSDKGLPESVDLQKSSGSARLDEAAKQAVLRTRFKPYLEDGKALAVYVIVPITFQMDR